MKNTVPSEGDLIETKDNLICDVKGLVHPPDKVVAFPRFLPDDTGSRKRKEATYRKIYSLADRFKFLEHNLPNYLVHDPVFDETLCEVPVEDISKHYRPAEKLRSLRKGEKLDPLETLALLLAELLEREAKIPWNAIGISGSLLAGFHTASSDIDPIVYGTQNCRKVYAVLNSLLSRKNEDIRPYLETDLEALFDFRSKDTLVSFENFLRTESRKVMQGKFHGVDYFMRFVKGWKEIDYKYGDVRYGNLGHARIKCTVSDDSEAIFTPCAYSVENVTILEGPKSGTIREIASFRGRFCEQARNGETILAQGKVESVSDLNHSVEYVRLLIGNKPSDFMIIES